MKTVVVLFGMVGAALCYPWSHPQPVADAPDVAAAKAAHLAAHASAGHSTTNTWVAEPRSWNGPEDDGSWTETKYDGSNGAWQGSYNTEAWQGVSHENGAYKDDGSWKHYDDGSWKDDAHFWNQASSGAQWESHEKKWTGPVALPPGYDKNGAPLQVLDTPEVAAAKEAHLAAAEVRRHSS